MRETATGGVAADGVRFGRTVIRAVGGDILGQGTEAIVVAANRRGVMGAVSTAGVSGIRSLGGSEIEREAMAQAPLELGSAIVTGAPGLESRGIRAVIHAVVHQALGDRARIEHVRRATGAALLAAHRSRLRTVAMPLLGLEAGTTDGERLIDAVVDELVAALRRSTLRLDLVVLVCRFDDHAAAAARALARARQRAWSRPSP